MDAERERHYDFITEAPSGILLKLDRVAAHPPAAAGSSCRRGGRLSSVG